MALAIKHKPVYKNYQHRNEYLAAKLEELSSDPKLNHTVESEVQRKLNSLYFEYLEGVKGKCEEIY